MDPLSSACRNTKERIKRPSTDSAIESMGFNSRHLDDWHDLLTTKKVNDLKNNRYTSGTDFQSNRYLVGREGGLGGRIDDNKCTNTWNHEPIEDEEQDLIRMIKNVLIEERLSDKHTISQLNDELRFLKNEILHKNNVINILLDSVEVLKKQTNKFPRHRNFAIADKEVKSMMQPRYQVFNQSEATNIPPRDHFVITQLDDCNNIDNSPHEQEEVCEFTEELPSNFEHSNDEVVISSASSISNSEENEELFGKSCSLIRARKIPGHIQKRGEPPVVEFPKRYLQRTKSLPATTTHLYREHLLLSNLSILSTSNPIFIVGDSVLTGLSSKRISRDKNIKIRSFPGGKIEDFYHYLIPLISKTPSKLIIHCGTNDAKEKPCDQILDELITLKLYAQQKLEKCDVTISFPIIRADNTRAGHVIEKLRNKLRSLRIEGIYHDNITEDHLTKKGFYLNQKGVQRLAMNFINFLRR